jgi:hypothetical protein
MRMKRRDLSMIQAGSFGRVKLVEPFAFYPLWPPRRKIKTIDAPSAIG